KRDGYFANDPTKIISRASIVIFIGLGSLYIFRNGLVLLDIIVCSVIFYVFQKIMAKRTAKGVAGKEHILGLKLYLQTAEAEGFKKLQGTDAAYAANHGAPTKTVELFEKLLPYAVALGVEKDWAKQFKDIYKQ